jgi:hypothetical protein
VQSSPCQLLSLHSKQRYMLQIPARLQCDLAAVALPRRSEHSPGKQRVLMSCSCDSASVSQAQGDAAAAGVPCCMTAAAGVLARRAAALPMYGRRILASARGARELVIPVRAGCTCSSPPGCHTSGGPNSSRLCAALSGSRDSDALCMELVVSVSCVLAACLVEFTNLAKPLEFLALRAAQIWQHNVFIVSGGKVVEHSGCRPRTDVLLQCNTTNLHDSSPANGTQVQRHV